MCCSIAAYSIYWVDGLGERSPNEKPAAWALDPKRMGLTYAGGAITIVPRSWPGGHMTPDLHWPYISV